MSASSRAEGSTWREVLDTTLTPAGGTAPPTTPHQVAVEHEDREDLTPPAGPTATELLDQLDHDLATAKPEHFSIGLMRGRLKAIRAALATTNGTRP